jgi:alkylation response protein AidB-like acyl-CoA dehydrogenase
MSRIASLGFGRSVFAPEHEAFRTTVRRFFQTEVAPNVREWQKAGLFPADLFKAAAQAGILGAGIPEEYGGAGGDLLHHVVFHEEHAYSPAGAALEGGLLTDMVAFTVLYAGTEEQKKEWLPRIARGETIVEVAISEADAGSDVRGIRTYARRDGSDYILNGSKMWLTNGPIMTMALVVAKVDAGLGPKDPITMFIVPLQGTKGVSVSQPIELMLKSAGGIAEISMKDVRIPKENVLGGVEGKGLRHAFSTLALGRMVVAARAIAACELALELTLEFVKSRKAFGQHIFDFQNTQFKLASVKADTAVGRAYIDDQLSKLANGTVDPTEAAIAKLWTTETEGRVMDECLQLFGGAGYSDEYPISKMFALARAHRIQAGTSEILRLIIGRSL